MWHSSGSGSSPGTLYRSHRSRRLGALGEKFLTRGLSRALSGVVEPQQIFASNQTMRAGQIERKCRVCLAGIGPRGHSEGIELGWPTPILVERYIRNDKS